MKHLTSLFDLTTAEVREILSLAQRLKDAWRDGHREPLCRGLVLTQIFEKPSLRTRVSFEAAMMQLGGSTIFMSSKEAGLEGREHHEDVARIVGGYSDVVVLRTFAQALIETFVQSSGKPVVNGLSDDFHPCQALTDALTIEEHFGDSAGRTLVYVGDGNNVAKSLLLVCAHLGMRFTIAAPEGFQLDDAFLSRVRKQFPDAQFQQLVSPQEAAAGADIIYTDVWASMGQEEEKDQRAAIFRNYQVNGALMELASSDAVFMHCLPARRGLEVSEEMMSSPRSIVFPQAENRMHLAKGLFAWMLK